MVATAKRRVFHLAGNLALLLVSTAIALLLAEFAFRAIKELQWRFSAKWWEHELYAMLPNSPLEYELFPEVTRENLIPDTGVTWQYRINSDGFRGADFAPQSDRRRVLFLGDSYTFGWAVDEENVLAEAVKRVIINPPYSLAIDVYNLGVPGYNTVQEYHLLTQVMNRYTPSLVVLGYVMNDGEPQQNVPQRPSVRYKYVTSWLLSFVKEQINYYLHEGKQVLHTGVNTHGNYLLAVQENGPKWAEGRQAFAAIVALCQERNIPLVVVIHPDYTQAFDDSYAYGAIHEEVSAWAEKGRVPALDVMQYMKGKDSKNYRVEGDGHPNEKAFAITAQLVAPAIYKSLVNSAPATLH